MQIIIGHKKPDSDSVISAIILAEIKKNQNEKLVPKIASPVNNETRFILKETGFKIPEIQENLYPIVADNLHLDYPTVGLNDKIISAITLMKKNNLIKIPVVANGVFKGIVSYYHIVEFIIDRLPKYDISKHSVKEFLIEEKTITPNTYVSSLKDGLSNNNYVRFVVSKNKYIGAITKQEILNPKKYKVILVDHNEYSQAIEGIEDANVIEIYDHHKVVLNSDSPINIRIRPLGSTCSVLYEYCLEKGLSLNKKIKKLLLYGIIADTVGFRLSTTTQLDKQYVFDLCDELKLDCRKIDDDIIKASTDISGASLKDLILSDFKDFRYDNAKVGVGVLNVANFEQISQVYEDLQKLLRTTKEDHGYDLILLLICEIISNRTKVIGYGAKINYLANHFCTKLKDDAFEVPGVLSRKKDVMPIISKAYA